MRRSTILFGLLLSSAMLPPGAAGQSGTPSPHGTLPQDLDCSACHTSESWSPARSPMRFDHTEQVGFGLTGAHLDVSCAACHLDLRFQRSDDTVQAESGDCAACHLDVHRGRLGPECASCHDTFGFRNVDGDLAHARTAFPLSGAHLQITCESCHTDDRDGAYSAIPTDCTSCHVGDYMGAVTVDHEANGYPLDCTRCHSVIAWTDAPSFDHYTLSSGFALLGAHTRLRCASCHVIPGLAVLHPASGPEDCVTCHQADYDKEHGGSGFGTECLQCHTMEDWDASDDFDHLVTGFALIGTHGSLDCASCHLGGHRDLRFAAPAAQNDCAACHQSDYDGEHAGTGYPTTCATCHSQIDWDATFDHVVASHGYALIGAHGSASCLECHDAQGGLLFAPPATSDDCVACHQSDYDEDHAGTGYPMTCLTCHTQDSWEATLDHAALSDGYPLIGAHESASCLDCHNAGGGLLFLEPTSSEDCVACHQVQYQEEHAGTGYPMECATCHTQANWDASLDHTALSGGFTLTGAHGSAGCLTCHTPAGDLLFPGGTSSSDCAACHQSDYDAEHAGSGFPTTCSSCHNETSWSGAAVDHTAISGGFVLVGAHLTAACATCHSPSGGLLFPPPASSGDCAACHQSDYDGQHAGSGFPTTCLSCHSQTTWSGATGDHATLSGGFTLVGAHDVAACTSCHTVPGYALLFPTPASSEDCATCHQSDYDAQHTGSGFPTTCLSCHSQSTWSGATVDHGAVSGGFPLVGAHDVAACTSCHAIPGYVLLFPTPAAPEDCVACHQPEYDGEHTGSGFPTTCLSCHTQNVWTGAVFDHDGPYFPIYSGAHREEWNDCSECHQTPGDFTSFTCLSCHEHRKDSMDDKHKEVTGYVYDSATCFSCHPRGKS